MFCLRRTALSRLSFPQPAAVASNIDVLSRSICTSILTATSNRNQAFKRKPLLLSNSVDKGRRKLGPRVQVMSLITINHSIVEALKKHKVIPDVIDEFTPSVFLQAEFPSGSEVQLGNTLKKEDTQSIPKITITPSNDTYSSTPATYTLCMTDPDAPSASNPKNSEFLHWLITDIKPETGVIDIDDTKELMKWMGPAPPAKTGKHRYVLLFFKNHNGKERLPEVEERKHWGLRGEDGNRRGARDFARKHGLTLVGVNFFFVQNEDQGDGN